MNTCSTCTPVRTNATGTREHQPSVSSYWLLRLFLPAEQSSRSDTRKKGRAQENELKKQTLGETLTDDKIAPISGETAVQDTHALTGRGYIPRNELAKLTLYLNP